MSDLSVLRVQELLRQSAEQGHDLTIGKGMVGIHGRMYPTMFKGLDISANQESWTSYSALPHENASVNHIHLNDNSMGYSNHPMHIYNLIPHMTSHGQGKYSPNYVNAYYVGANTHTHLRDDGFRRDMSAVSPSGLLHTPYLDEKGNEVNDVHGFISHNSQAAMRGVVDDMERKESRHMTKEELGIHRTVSSPGQGLVSQPLVSNRISPIGLISINHYTGRHLETPGLEQYLYHPETERLVKL